MKNLLVIPLLMLSLTACGNNNNVSTIKPNDDPTTEYPNVTAFKGSRYIRVNIDGVDCIIGSGTYDTTTSISCDWPNKDK